MWISVASAKLVDNQFRRYLFHVVEIIGGANETSKTVEQKGNVLEYIDRGRQKEAVGFLGQQLFTTPEWIFDRRNFMVAGGGGYVGILNLQKGVLSGLLSASRLNSLVHAQTLVPGKAYAPDELLDDLKEIIWSEIKAGKPIDLYRRNLQKAYVAQLLSL